MARFKQFRGGRKIEEFEPVMFELNDETFKCYSAIPGAVLLEFVRDATDEENGNSASALYNFLESAMPDAEYKRLQELLKKPDVIIDIEMIGEIVSWLVEEFSDRPTQQPEDSQNGQLTSGPVSMGEHYYKAAN